MKRACKFITGLSASVLLGISAIGSAPVQRSSAAIFPTGVISEPNLWNGVSGTNGEAGFCDDASDDIFEALVLVSGWSERLDTYGNGQPRYTIFQPFDQLLEDLLDSLGLAIGDLSSQPTLVQATLADHIANGSFDETELESVDLTRITMRSGYVATVVGDSLSSADGNRTLYNNVYIAGSFIRSGAQFANGWLYCIDGIIDPNAPDPLVISWTSPTSPTSSKYLLFELSFSRPVVTILRPQDFDNLGSQPSCSMNPIPENGTQPSQRYFLVVICPGFGTVQPSLNSLEVTTIHNSKEINETLIDSFGGSVIDIVNGVVLTLSRTGSGQGTVTSNVSGINCGVLCSGVFSRQARITLTAQPAPGSIFVGWNGACSGSSSCRLTLSSSVNVTAQFELATRVVVNAVGDGAGTVTSAPSAVNCSALPGSSCSTNVRPGQQMTLTARPSRGSRFVGWMGSCTGSGTCSIPAQFPGQSIHVFAIFERA